MGVTSRRIFCQKSKCLRKAWQHVDAVKAIVRLQNLGLAHAKRNLAKYIGKTNTKT